MATDRLNTFPVLFQLAQIWCLKKKKKTKKIYLQFNLMTGLLFKGTLGENVGGAFLKSKGSKGINDQSIQRAKKRAAQWGWEGRLGHSSPNLTSRCGGGSFRSYSTIRRAHLMEHTAPLINPQIMLTVHSQVTFNVTPPLRLPLARTISRECWRCML